MGNIKMECRALRKQKTEKKVQKIESELKKFGFKNELSPESIDTWMSYYRTYSNISKAMMKSKMRDEKKIKELCMKKELVPEKVQEWILFYQQNSSFVPIGFIEEQIQQGKDISLEQVRENNQLRSKFIEEFALKVALSLEESSMWVEICAKMPHIRKDVIKNHMKNKYTPDEFKLIICKYEIANAISHSLDKCSESRSYDICNIHIQDEQICASGDASYWE